MDKFEILEIELQKINLEPGDVLSAKLIGQDMDQDTMDSLQDHLRKVFPNNKVMVFAMPKDSDIQFTAISPAPPAQVSDCSVPTSYCNDCSCGKKERIENENT